MYEQNVAAGAQFLDEKSPGWWEAIDVEALDLGCAAHCVLGQLGGDFLKGTVKFGLHPETVLTEGLPNEPAACQECADLGFYIPGQAEEVNAEYKALTAAWVAEIETRTADAEARELVMV